MNSYNLGFGLSPWFLTLFVVVGIAFSFYIYKHTIPYISKGKKSLLITLRSLALALLLLALFEPILAIVRSTAESPKVAVALDNSISASLTDAGGDRKTEYKKTYDNINFNKFEQNDVSYYLFDENTNKTDNFTFDSLKFNGNLTDLSKPIRTISKTAEQENTRAIVLISDGAFNTGFNPLYDAEYFGKPIYVVGIGDTNLPKDIALQSIITNEIAYIDNPVPVNVNLKVSGYKEGKIELVMYDNGIKVTQQDINVYSEKQDYSAVFEYMPKIEGHHKISFTASQFDGEITYKNNTLAEYINVLKNKRNYLLLAGAPNPDITFLKNVLNKEKGVEIKEFIQKQGSEFYNQAPTRKDFSDAEVIILIGFPISSSPSNVLLMLKEELTLGKSLFFIGSQNLDFSKLRFMEEVLPFNILSFTYNEYLALPDFKREALSSPLLKVLGLENDLELWNQLPPIYHTETYLKPKPTTEIISTLKINNVALAEPLIITNSTQNRKSVAVLGYGLYRWKMLGYASDISKGKIDAHNLYDIFVQNCFKWLTIDQINKNVRIKTSKKFYYTGEKVEFLGQVYDASYNPIENAQIKVKITSLSQTKEITLQPLGNGRYTSLVDGLAEGDYSFNGECFVNNQKLGSDNGRFSVGETAIEYSNYTMNIALLRSLAERTGGKFYLPNETANLLSDIQNNPSFKEKPLTARTEIPIWNSPFLLVIAILLFAIEWFLRKRYGMI